MSITVESLNNGHVGDMASARCRELSIFLSKQPICIILSAVLHVYVASQMRFQAKRV